MSAALISTIKTPVRVVANKPVDSEPQARANLSPEQREYYMEKRRALLTELKALNKLLGIKSE